MVQQSKSSESTNNHKSKTILVLTEDKLKDYNQVK